MRALDALDRLHNFVRALRAVSLLCCTPVRRNRHATVSKSPIRPVGIVALSLAALSCSAPFGPPRDSFGYFADLLDGGEQDADQLSEVEAARSGCEHQRAGLCPVPFVDRLLSIPKRLGLSI